MSQIKFKININLNMSKGVVKTWEEEEKYGPLVDHK